MIAIHVSVVAAFFDSGLRNAGTPSAMASTPVSATAPDENARSMISAVVPVSSAPLWVISSSASWFTGQGVRDRRSTSATNPMRMSPAERDDVDVGRAREEAPRLLQAAEVRRRVISTMNPRQSTTRELRSSGKAESIAATPAETDTATVST